MQNKHKLDYDGQALDRSDFNDLGDVAALADDRVLAEFLHLRPYDGSTVTKAIVHGGRWTGLNGSSNPHIVQGYGGIGATGTIGIAPFRAVVGTRALISTSPTANWNDIRSALFLPNATGTEPYSSTLLSGFAANSSGNPRWDLVYAHLVVDTGATSLRKVKSTSTGVVSVVSVVPTVSTTVQVLIAQGTPGATPAYPTVPADTTTDFYIPLAYIRIKNTFDPTVTVITTEDIQEVAPVVSLKGSVRPADQSGIATSNTSYYAGASGRTFGWDPNNQVRPPTYLPPSMAGGESLMLPIELSSVAPTNSSFPSGSIVDASADWRNRMFRWFAYVTSGSTSFGWGWNSPSPPGAGGPANTTITGAQLIWGFGHSFASNNAGDPAYNSLVASLVGSGSPLATAGYFQNCSNFNTRSADMFLYVDASGRLCIAHTNTPFVQIFMWLDASPSFGST